MAAIDNATIVSVNVTDPGSGYAPGYGPPLVTFPRPDAGGSFPAAAGRALLRPSGRVLRIDLADRGAGYAAQPNVVVSPPSGWGGDGSPPSGAARARAFIFKEGLNRGRVERIQLDDPGNGYGGGEKIEVRIDPPPATRARGGGWPAQAAATAVAELEVGGIELTSGGSGYA